MEAKDVLTWYLVGILVATLIGCLFVRPATAVVNSSSKKAKPIREPSYLQAIVLIFLAQVIAAVLPVVITLGSKQATASQTVGSIAAFFVYIAAFGGIFAAMMKTSLGRGLLVGVTHAVIQTIVVAGCAYMLVTLSA
jgi:hypothetical protein